MQDNKDRSPCACGCGRLAKLGNKWINGHTFIGRHHTAETLAKMSKNCSMKRPEVRAKVSRAKIGNIPGNKGKKDSPQTRAKKSRAQALSVKEGRHKLGRSIGGDFYSRKNGKILHYRSQLELSWYQVLEALEKVHKYYVEPTIIPYEWEGAIHHYTPDLRIRYTDGTTELVEIKPESRWKDPQNQAKFKAARAWCAKRRVSTTFRVVGYEGIKDA